MKRMTSGGGFPAIRYAIRMARQAGGFLRFYRALRSKNACKTCALGMGGQQGGMVDESGHFPEVCKKSMQAMAADMQGRIRTDFFETHSFPKLKQLTPRQLEHAGRLTQPLYAGPGDQGYHPIDWDQALAFCGDWLKQTSPDENFFYVSGRSSNEAGFLLQLFARLYGTNNVNNCSYLCHQASGVGLTAALGAGTATIVLDDLEHCDLLFLIGGNPASNHPRLMRQLMKLRRRGGQVIVINPVKEMGLVNFSVPSDVRSLFFGSPIASQYVQPHIGGDIALITGIAKAIDSMGAVDEGFLNRCTDDWSAWRDHIRAVDWSTITASSGVDRAAIEDIARVYAQSEKTVFAWTMGITHHRHGVDNVRAIVNLALMRGMVGKPGAGLMPIRGHSNVQGIGSMGVTPKLKQAIFDRLENHFGVSLPTSTGLDPLACFTAMDEGRMRGAWCLGGNLYGATPDRAYAERCLGHLDHLVYFSTTLNTGHAFGRGKETLILPMLARDEEPQPTTQESMFSFVRLSEGGPSRHVGPRSEVEVVASIAGRVLGDQGPIDWKAMQEHKTIRQAIGAIVPGFEEIARIDETKAEFQIDGRTFHEPKFPTDNGRAKIAVVQIPAQKNPDTLTLMTIRSEGQFNTVVYEEEDIYRHQERRDVILMHADDIHRLGLTPDQRVTVRSEVGAMKNILVRPFEIRAGNAAMYFPEANALVPALTDPQSRTPAYKSVAITIVARSNPTLVHVDVGPPAPA